MNDRDKNEIQADAMRLHKGGADVETLLRLMRERGLSQGESSLMLGRVTGLDFAESQRRVFESKTWADRFEVNVQLQKDFMEAWREVAQENKDPRIKIEIEPDPDLDPPKS